MNHELTLEAAAAATGQSVNRLRAWCATGELQCEKDGHGWVIPSDELERVGALVAQRDAMFAAGHAQALVIPAASAFPELRAEVAHRLGLPAAAVATNTLALDGKAYVLAVWHADGVDGTYELASLIELAEELGGQLLDGEGTRE
jgi:hypothetical protein